jgi:hypothetical protein
VAEAAVVEEAGEEEEEEGENIKHQTSNASETPNSKHHASKNLQAQATRL